MKRLLRRLTAVLCALALCLTSVLALDVPEAIALLEELYIDDLPPAAYEAATLDELFGTLEDPYTYYMTAEDYASFTSGVESETTVTGIGAMIELTAEGIVLTAVLDGGGAKEAGLQKGDVIIAVDGESCVPAGNAHRDRIVGAEGTAVILTVRHPDGTISDHAIVRRTVTIHNTTVTVRGSAGWIDCESFGSQTADYFRDGVETYDSQVDYWVVDLRGNTGGLASAATEAISVFAGVGAHLYYRSRAGKYYANYGHNDALTDKPVIVLIDDHSASASEVFAGGIRSYGLGIILGPRSYGKGVAQLVRDETTDPKLFDGDALKITAYRFFSPDGNTSDKIGVIPTLYLRDEYVDGALALLRTEPPEGNYLHVVLRETFHFYVSLDEALREENRAAFTELFDALPPDLPVYCWDAEVGEIDLTPSAAALYYSELRAPQRYFPDTGASPFRDKIDALGTYRILRGKDGGRFDPTGSLTRAELCAMLAQALNVTTGTDAGFTDVTERDWFFSPVGAMARLGLVQGTGDGRFLPNGTLTQEQFFTVMGRLAAFLNFSAYEYDDIFRDEALLDTQPLLAPYAPWARRGVQVLNGMLVDMNDNPAPMLWTDLADIDPHAAVTREQAAATLFNVLRMLGALIY